MFTEIVNSKRVCLSVYMKNLNSWDYIKYLLTECGFETIQEASSKEYVMKGCRNKVLVYVKFPYYNYAIIIFMNATDHSDQINIKFRETKDYHIHGEEILTKIREIWFL